MRASGVVFRRSFVPETSARASRRFLCMDVCVRVCILYYSDDTALRKSIYTPVLCHSSNRKRHKKLHILRDGFKCKLIEPPDSALVCMHVCMYVCMYAD